MYCDAIDSPRRRATQSAMREIVDTLTKLLAPILVFTAEEAWGYLGEGDSIHLREFPQAKAEWQDSDANNAVTHLLKLRGIIGQAVEQARQEKLIGNALEAAVVLRCDTASLQPFSREELEEFFILSDLTLEQAESTSASISRTPHAKCARCWRHRSTVGANAAHPDLCDRCAAVVTAGQRS
jgi:isoleucyl-tRNA synthetase